MNNINISGIKIFPISNGIGGCIGVAQFILNGVIKLTGVKLFNKNGTLSGVVNDSQKVCDNDNN